MWPENWNYILDFMDHTEDREEGDALRTILYGVEARVILGDGHSEDNPPSDLVNGAASPENWRWRMTRSSSLYLEQTLLG